MKEILISLFVSVLIGGLFFYLLISKDKTRHDLVSAQMDNVQLKNRLLDYESKEVVENAYMVDVMHGGKE